jgi:hypothetical protein
MIAREHDRAHLFGDFADLHVVRPGHTQADRKPGLRANTIWVARTLASGARRRHVGAV